MPLCRPLLQSLGLLGPQRRDQPLRQYEQSPCRRRSPLPGTSCQRAPRRGHLQRRRRVPFPAKSADSTVLALIPVRRSGPFRCGLCYDQYQPNAALLCCRARRRSATLRRLRSREIAAHAAPAVWAQHPASTATGGQLHLPERQVQLAHQPRELLHTMRQLSGVKQQRKAVRNEGTLSSIADHTS